MKKLTKFAVIADPHYYSEKLGCSGEAYERRAGSDQKMLAPSKGTVAAALEAVKNSDAQFLMIAGDLSNDGELCSHEEIREMLYDFKKHMPVQTESDKKPEVSIPSKDVTITVNDKQQLVAQNKETGEEEVLDDKKTYTVEEKEDGSVEIVDKDGEKVVVEENGDVLLAGKEIVTVGATSVEEKTPEKQNPVIYVVIIAAVVVVGVLYAKRKKSTK